jgi:Ca-activated chloride channel family protein
MLLIMMLMASTVQASSLREQVINYNKANAYSRKGDYQQSAELLKALRTAGISDKISADVDYNLGNALFKLAENDQNLDINQRLKLYENALEQYDQLIARQVNAKDAEFNQRITQERIKQLKERQKQQSSSNQDSTNQENSQENKENKDEQQNQDDNKKQQQNQSQQQGQEDKEQSKQKSQEQENQRQDQQQQENEQRQDQQQENENSDSPQDSAEQQQDHDSLEQPQEDALKKEAKRLLRDYQRQQEAKGLLYFIQQSGDGHVGKDW